MNEFTGLYYTEDGANKEITSFETDVLRSGTILYEVIRIQNGTPLFLEDHLARLLESIRLSALTYTVALPVTHQNLSNLSRINDIANGNVKIILHFQKEAEPMLYTGFVPHFYPTGLMVQEGVETDFFKAERLDPNIKKLHAEMIQRASTLIKTENLYDVLLVDDDDTVTEGSKTNAFFVRGKIVYTAPGEKVLRGITRGKIFFLCKQLNIKLIERSIPTKGLHDFDAAFFTGTSPKVLPIRRIANIEYTVTNQVMRSLVKAYDDLIMSYINSGVKKD